MPRSTGGEVPTKKILAAATGEAPPVQQISRTRTPPSPLGRLFRGHGSRPLEGKHDEHDEHDTTTPAPPVEPKPEK